MPPKRAVPKHVDVKSLILDPNNPRFANLNKFEGRENLSQEELLEELGNDEQIPTLLKAVKRSGVRNPIWLKDLDDGKYLVIEGNRRTYILKKLIEDEVVAPPGVQYDIVEARVYPPDTGETELLLQRVALQAGQKDWLPFNVSVTTYQLRHIHNMEEEDISIELQISKQEVRKRIKDMGLMIEYVKKTNDTNPKKYSFFQDAPKRVQDWIDENKKNKETYFDLISPKDGGQQIRSTSTKGGLRDFAEVIDHPKILNEFIKDENMTVEDACEIIKNENPLEDAPFLKRLGTLANQLISLTDEQVTQIKFDKGMLNSLKKLNRTCDNIIRKIGSDE